MFREFSNSGSPKLCPVFHMFLTKIPTSMHKSNFQSFGQIFYIRSYIRSVAETQTMENEDFRVSLLFLFAVLVYVVFEEN